MLVVKYLIKTAIRVINIELVIINSFQRDGIRLGGKIRNLKEYKNFDVNSRLAVKLGIREKKKKKIT